MLDSKRYIIAFIITGCIFAFATYISSHFNQQRLQEIQSIQEGISTDILSSETQFSLLSELSCKEVGQSILSREIDELGEKIEYSEQTLGNNSTEILQLKKFYSLLEIKDYLLMKRINDRCGKNIMFAFYFYGDDKKCPDCRKAGYALTGLRETYPDLRVYSFDYALDLSVIKTLITIFDIKDQVPAIVIGDNVHYGLHDKETLETFLKQSYPKQIAILEEAKKLSLEP